MHHKVIPYTLVSPSLSACLLLLVRARGDTLLCYVLEVCMYMSSSLANASAFFSFLACDLASPSRTRLFHVFFYSGLTFPTSERYIAMIQHPDTTSLKLAPLQTAVTF